MKPKTQDPLPGGAALLERLDLNLLRVFDALITHRRVSLASAHLRMSQPAVSGALGRLRAALDDPLFVKTGRGMEPTPHAVAIARPVAEALRSLARALDTPRAFDAGSSERGFTVAMTDIGEVYLLPRILAALDREAPSVIFSTVRNHAVNLKEALADGAVDLALGWMPALGPGFFHRRLFSQRYVCVARRDHPALRRGFGREAFLRARHMVVVSDGSGHGQVETRLARAGVRRFVRLRVPHFVSVPTIIASSDLVATVPQALASSTAQRFGLAVLPHPVPLPAFQINLYWHRRFQHDAANRWLRELIHGLAAE